MELKEILERMQEEENTKAVSRADYIKTSDWIGVATEIIKRVKKLSDVNLMGMRLDHINGLQIRVICKAGKYTDVMKKVIHIDMEVWEKYLNTWGNFRTHDERAYDHLHLEPAYFMIPVK